MKTKYLIAIAALISLSFFSSCTKEDDEVEETYTLEDEDGAKILLEWTINDTITDALAYNNADVDLYLDARPATDGALDKSSTSGSGFEDIDLSTDTFFPLEDGTYNFGIRAYWIDSDVSSSTDTVEYTITLFPKSDLTDESRTFTGKIAADQFDDSKYFVDYTLTISGDGTKFNVNSIEREEVDEFYYE